MFILDKPYISSFLIETIKVNRFKVIATPVARSLIQDDALLWIPEKDAIHWIKNNPHQPLYTNSENALDWIVNHFPESTLARQIHVLKDKVKFRGLIKNIFPDFNFRQIEIEKIQQLHAEDLPFPFVIKPAIGFFSVGVHIVNDEEDWIKVKRELTPENLNSIFPETVLNTSQFIIEELIIGEEYAIDYYHDHEGKVVILNMLHHIFSSGTDTSDRVYTTSKAMITEHQHNIEEFLTRIGENLELKNFPAHAEVRIRDDGEIMPIEINPMRFGGWCTTADLMGVALGFNTYAHYIHDEKPDWDSIFKEREDKLFSIVVLDNNSGIEDLDIIYFDYEKLVADFEKPLLMRKSDIRENSVFGFLFTETSKGNEKELYDILTSDLRKYITSK